MRVQEKNTCHLEAWLTKHVIAKQADNLITAVLSIAHMTVRNRVQLAVHFQQIILSRHGTIK